MGGGQPIKKEKLFFLYFFSISSPNFPILRNKKVFSRWDPKIKVVPNFMPFNFAKRSKVKFQIDFETEI
jgi:hypothetical protein